MITRLNSLGFNELVAEYEVTGSAATTITFNGLDINADGGYTIVCEIVSAASTVNHVEIAINTDASNSNYSGRYIDSQTTTRSTGTSEAPRSIAAISATSGQISFSTIDMMLINGYVCWNNNQMRYNTTSALLHFIKHNVSQTNITRLDFTSSVASSIGIGSKIKIYRWRQCIHTLNSLAQGRLVWSHEVTGSAVTSVTATGLDILRDGSYKVVVGLVSAASSEQTTYININGDATSANYTRRYIESSGTGFNTGSTASKEALRIGTSGQITFFTVEMTIINGYCCHNIVGLEENTTKAQLLFIKYNQVINNVTSLVFATTGNYIGVGSKFYIFRTN